MKVCANRPGTPRSSLFTSSNPYGMAWLRRVNEHNVDLNRNFLGPDETYTGAPDGYQDLDDCLNPAGRPGFELFHLRAGGLILRHGIRTLKQTVAGGQYVNPRGLFFGGQALEEGPRAFRRFVEHRLSGVEHVVVVDVHTGLGSFGEQTLLVNADETDPEVSRLRDAFGDGVASLDPGRGPAYRVRGSYDTLYDGALPNAKVDAVSQEFGTYTAPHGPDGPGVPPRRRPAAPSTYRSRRVTSAAARQSSERDVKEWAPSAGGVTACYRKEPS